MFKLDSLAKKIGFGYIIVGLMLCFSVGTTVYLVNGTSHISDDLREHRVPTTQAGLTVLAGINQSLAALLGWMILGDERFLDERALAWDEKIYHGLTELSELSEHWDEQEDRDRLTSIKTKIRKFERYQDDIEDIANKEENFPAIMLFSNQVKPIADHLIERIVAIETREVVFSIDDDRQQIYTGPLYERAVSLLAATEKLLVEAEGYLLIGSEKSLSSYHLSLKHYSMVYGGLIQLNDHSNDLNEASKKDLRIAFQLSEQLVPLIEEMVKIRQSEQWNMASYWLRTRASPHAAEMVSLLESIIDNAQTAMNNQFNESRRQSHLLNRIVWGLLVIGLAFCAIMGVIITRSVSVPILRTLDVADAVSKGDFDIDTEFKGSSEIVSLGRSLGAMTASLRATTAAAEAVANGQLDVVVEVKSDNDRLARSVNSMLDAIRDSKAETERQLTALVDSESRSNSIINNMEDGLVNITGEGLITLFNPAAERIFQYSADEVIGRNIRILVPNPHSEKHDNYLSTYLRTGDRRFIGAPRDVEAQRKDGSTFPASIVVSEIIIGGEKNFIGTVRDFTKQKRIEEDEIRAREALESEKEKLLEQDWLKSSYASIVERLQGSRSLKGMCDELLNTMLPIMNAQIGVFYIRDGVDKVESIESSGSEVFSIMSSYAYKYRNTSINKYSIGEGLVGQAALERKPIVIRDAPSELLSIDTGIGEVSTGTVMVLPVLFENDLLGVLEIGALNDFSLLQHELLEQIVDNVGVFISTIVARSRAEHLLALSEAQSKVLKQRENELKEANVEMKRKTDVAEQANRTKSEFLANMSHELRTPLNSLLILAESLSVNRDGNLTDHQQEAASIIYQSGSDLLVLINDILDLAKVEAGKMVLNNEVFLIHDIEATIRNQFAHIAEEKGLGFEVCFLPEVPDEMVGDKQRIEQVIKNFLSNAFKFTEKGRVTLTIKGMSDINRDYVHALGNDNCIAFEVRDTGIGIPSEKLSKIFNAFEQVDGSTSREYGGTGLGLRICEELAMLLGGIVTVDSEVDVGSVFIMTIPLDARSIESSLLDENTHSLEKASNANVASNSGLLSSKKKSPEKSVSDNLTAHNQRQCILVVEDDKHFAAILEASIRKENIRCLTARDGKSALEMAHQYLPSAIVMDIGLPDISGIEVFAELKSSPETSHIPVYFMSVHDEIDNEMLKGAVGYLTKPMSQTQLDSALNTLIAASNCEHKAILVVDDDTVTQDYLAPIFEQKGFDVDFAGSAEEALRCLEEGAYSGMLLDLMLPGMSGLELLQYIGNDPYMTQPPVVVYSAKDMGDEEHEALAQYTHSFVAKNSRSSTKVISDLLAAFETSEQPGSSAVPISIASKVDSNIVKNTASGVEIDAILMNKHVLLVDDDTRNIFALSLLLKQVGMMVTIADNGKKALEILESNQSFDIVLMDIMMPVMDGYEAIKRIRAQDRFLNLPIIAVTAKAMSEDRDHCLEIGATDYLAKPIEATELFHIMKKSLCQSLTVET
ncbi:MAG: response regulator [Thiotrichaceae bacterium]|nr:response regulator [Thiotrichaceae bacterium]